MTQYTSLRDDIISYEEDIWFDPSELNIFYSGWMTLRNRGRRYTYASGVRGAEVWLGYYNRGRVKRCTGLSGHIFRFTHAQGGMTNAQIDVADRSIALRAPSGRMLVNPPAMDGWCIYKAARWLANFAGVTDDFLGFPWCDGDYWDPNHNPNHYTLPAGAGLKPRVKFPLGMYVWDALNILRKYAGHVMFFDADGRLQFYPWIPSVPGQYKKWFRETPSFDPNGEPMLDELHAIETERNLLETRNRTTIVGIDPNTWQPIITCNADTESIYNTDVINFKGYWSDFVWADSIFVSSAYAQDVADRLHAIYRLPAISTTWQTWMQPELFPLDVCAISDSETIGGTLPFWITRIHTVASKTGERNVCQARIEGRWLTPWG